MKSIADHVSCEDVNWLISNGVKIAIICSPHDEIDDEIYKSLVLIPERFAKEQIPFLRSQFDILMASPAFLESQNIRMFTISNNLSVAL